jgi:hypothetical protein
MEALPPSIVGMGLCSQNRSGGEKGDTRTAKLASLSYPFDRPLFDIPSRKRLNR